MVSYSFGLDVLQRNARLFDQSTAKRTSVITALAGLSMA
jgi:hypothetical protein